MSSIFIYCSFSVVAKAVCVILCGCPFYALWSLIASQKWQYPKHSQKSTSVSTFCCPFPSYCPRVRNTGLGMLVGTFLFVSLYGPLVHECMQLLFELINTVCLHYSFGESGREKNPLGMPQLHKINKFSECLFKGYFYHKYHLSIFWLSTAAGSCTKQNELFVLIYSYGFLVMLLTWHVWTYCPTPD